MNNEIDSLSLKIKVEGLQGQAKTINTFAAALETLSSVLKNSDFDKLSTIKLSDDLMEMGAERSRAISTFANGIKKLSESLKTNSDFSSLATVKISTDLLNIKDNQVKNLIRFANAVKILSDSLKGGVDFSALKTIETPKGVKAMQLVNQTVNNAPLKNAKLFSFEAEKMGEVATAYSKIADVKKKFGKVLIQPNEEGLPESMNGYNELMDALLGINKQSKKGSKNLSKFGKVLKRIKLIAFIKLIRGALNSLIKGFQSGIQKLAVFDKDFNETMSKLKSLTTQLFSSITLTFQPLIEAILPAMQSLTSVFVELGNAISKANAQMKGLSTYTKISSKYMEDYAQSAQKGALFSFDTFNTLNLEESPFETAEISEEENKEASALLETITLIKEAGEKIKELIQVITPFIEKILKIINPILNIIIKISNRATTTIIPVIQNILNLIGDILETVLGLIGEAFEELDPLIQAINVDLLPPLVSLITDILQPILRILKQLPVKEIVGLIVDILVPAIKIIGSIIDVIDTILTPLMNVFANFFAPVLKEVGNIIQVIRDVLSPLLDNLAIFFEQFADIFGLIAAFISGDMDKVEERVKRLFSNIVKWVKNAFMSIVRGGASVLDWLMNRMIEAINTIIANDFIKWIVERFGGHWEGITWRSNLAGQVPSFANGGVVGELWQMNEYGIPEMLYNSNNSGNTSVINQAQLSLAFEQAIYNTGLLDTIANAGNISIDGRAIAQSKNFKNELNRTNPKLNLR